MVRFYLAAVLSLFGLTSLLAQAPENPRRAIAERKPIDPGTTPAIVEAEVLIAEWNAGGDGKAGPIDVGVGTAELTKKIGELEKQGQLTVLHRIRLASLDGQQAMVQLGERRPRVVGSQSFGGGGRGGPGGGGFSNSISFESIGTLVNFMPQVLADGGVTMTLNIEKSGPKMRADSPVLSESPTGEKIRSESTGTLTVQTVVRLASGQSAVVAGLSGKEDQFLVLVSAKVTR